jgi:hypothetical protein
MQELSSMKNVKVCDLQNPILYDGIANHVVIHYGEEYKKLVLCSFNSIIELFLFSYLGIMKP